MIYIDKYYTPIGEIILTSNGHELTGLWFDKQKYAPNDLEFCEQKDIEVFRLTRNWLDIYFSGEVPKFTPALNFKDVSPFCKRVLEILLKIPYGRTLSYGEIAKQIEKDTGKRASAQAVGGAVGHNPISIIIPCHRVVGTDGSLTGYAGGIDRKMKLLALEGVNNLTSKRVTKEKKAD